MPRKKAAVTINITFHETGEKCKIELCRSLFNHWSVRFNRRNSSKVQSATISEVCSRLRRLLVLKTGQ